MAASTGDLEDTSDTRETGKAHSRRMTTTPFGVGASDGVIDSLSSGTSALG
jgi:hypothetical protein